MTSELKIALDKILALLRKQNLHEFSNEEIFIDELRPEILKAAAEIEKPEKEQNSII